MCQLVVLCVLIWLAIQNKTYRLFLKLFHPPLRLHLARALPMETMGQLSESLEDDIDFILKDLKEAEHLYWLGMSQEPIQRYQVGINIFKILPGLVFSSVAQVPMEPKVATSEAAIILELTGAARGYA